MVLTTVSDNFQINIHRCHWAMGVQLAWYCSGPSKQDVKWQKENKWFICTTDSVVPVPT